MFRPFYSAIVRQKHYYTFGEVCYGRVLSFTIFILVALRPNAGQGLLILQVSRSQTTGHSP